MDHVDRTQDRHAIRALVTSLSDAWEARDGAAWGSCFTDDADFTVWFGLRIRGRMDIAEGHQWVFDEVYPGTRYQLDITDFRFLGADAAILHIEGSVIQPGENLPDEPHSLPVAAVKRVDGEWKLVMFHNMQNRTKEMEARRSRGDWGDIR